MSGTVVRAAGAVVWRTGEAGLEVLLVHRPKYDDWSFAKGKREKGETDAQCALREVAEETGIRGRLGDELLPCRYRDRKGRPKVVRYWAMQVTVTAPFVANHEVDEVRWLTVEAALATLSYAHDADVLQAAATHLARAA